MSKLASTCKTGDIFTFALNTYNPLTVLTYNTLSTSTVRKQLPSYFIFSNLENLRGNFQTVSSKIKTQTDNNDRQKRGRKKRGSEDSFKPLRSYKE